MPRRYESESRKASRPAEASSHVATSFARKQPVCKKQLLTMSSRAGNAQQLVSDTSAELATVEQQFEEYHQSVQTKQSALDLVVKALQECRTAIAEYREKHTAAFSDSTRLENQLHGSAIQNRPPPNR